MKQRTAAARYTELRPPARKVVPRTILTRGIIDPQAIASVMFAMMTTIDIVEVIQWADEPLNEAHVLLYGCDVSARILLPILYQYSLPHVRLHLYCVDHVKDHAVNLFSSGKKHG